MKIAKEKLRTIEERLNPNGTVATRMNAEEVALADAELFAKFGLAFDLQSMDPILNSFNLDGTAAD
jgi:hypothetical protein